jgi:hypothetical protein
MGQFKFSLNEKEYGAVMRKLGTLSTVEQRAVIRKAYKESGKILITAGKSSYMARNKKRTGGLYRSLTAKLKKKNSGVLSGFRRGPGLGNGAHLIDRGTADRYTKKGYYRGRIDGTDNGKTGRTYFWTDVVEAKGDEAMNRIMDAVFDAVEEIKNRN